MSKKKETKGKDPKKGKPGLDQDPEPWVKELNTIVINDEHWQCHVNMIVERNPYNVQYIKSVNDIFDSGQNNRHHIKLLSDSALALELLKISYNNNLNISHGYKKFCEHVVKYCSRDGLAEHTPVSIIAYAIKYYIYSLKLKYLDEVRVIETYKQRKDKVIEESLLNIQNIMKNDQSPTKKPIPKSPTKSATSKKGGKETVVPAKFTDIRKREEEILDIILKDTDKPVDGPQLYIILDSFKNADLPLELLKLQVPLTSLIKLHSFCTTDKNYIISEDENRIIYNGLEQIFNSTIYKERKFSDATEERQMNAVLLDSFWSQFHKVLENKNNVLIFKDTIFIKFFPKLYDNLLRNDDTTILYKQVQQSFYNQLCHLQYDIQDVKRQYHHYINHLIDCEVENITDRNDMSCYTSAIEEIPPETINVPIILHCMLDQVEKLFNNKKSHELSSENVEVHTEVLNRNRNTTEDSLNSKLLELDVANDLFNKPVESIQENDSLLSIGVLKHDKNIAPDIIIHGDEVGIKSHWWDKTENIKEVTCKILKSFWEAFIGRRLSGYDYISLEESNETELFYMLRDSGDISIHDKLCNMPCTFDETALIVEDKTSEFCIDDDFENDYESVKDVNENCDNQRTCLNINHKSLPHYEHSVEGHYEGQLYDKHSYCFEEITSDIMLQNLFSAWGKFNCVDLFQDCFKNKIFMKFHHRKTCCKEEYRMGSLKTKIAIRDFYDYTIDEEFYWLNEQEVLYDKVMKKKDLDQINDMSNRMEYLKKRVSYMVGKICSDSKFLLYNTLKGGDQPQPLMYTKIPSYVEDKDEFKASSLSFDEVQHFQSFNIDLPNRVQFSERKQEFIISRDSKLEVKKLSRLYQNDDLFLQASINDHTLYFFQPIGSTTSDTFHLTHSSGMIFYFEKNKPENVNIDENTDAQQNINKLDLYMDTTNIFLKPLLYQLSFSLPNTLCLEFINPNYIPLYIKQYYLTNISLREDIKNEKYRCYLTEGKLIKFMTDNTIIIYYPTSEIFTCKTIEPMSGPSVPENTQKVKTEQKDTKSKNKQFQPPPQNEIPTNSSFSDMSYDYTSAAGNRISFNKGEVVELESLLCKSYTDIFNGVIVTERSDGTVITHNKEGVLFVDFPDGTRIKTIAYFSPEEIDFPADEILDEANYNYIEETPEKIINSSSEEDLEVLSPRINESFEEFTYEYNFNYRMYKSESFTMINVQHYIEHLNFASIFCDLNTEDLNICLPSNVNISLSSEGLYTINFDQKAEFVTNYNDILFREINDLYLPEFVIHLSENINTISKENNTKDEVDLNIDSKQNDNSVLEEKSQPFALLSCKDISGNTLTVNNKGDVQINMQENSHSICKCNTFNDQRIFVFDVEYKGLEVFPPNILDTYSTETNLSENCIIHNYGTVNHQVMLTLKPLIQNEKEKWNMPLIDDRFIPLYNLPSTYNDKTTFFNPFPKKRVKSENKCIPNVLSIRVINRVNCNIHLELESFIKNKKIADLLRLTKHSHLALELFLRGNIPFNKADKAFVEYVKNIIIGSLISRVRSRVVKRLEMKMIKEYMNILINRLLLPYFDSAQGAVFLVLFDVIQATVQVCSEKRTNLENLFYLPLNQLTNQDLDYMHDRIAPLTISHFCNCDVSREICKLRILLSTGTILYDIFPDMMTIFYSYGRNLKMKMKSEMVQRQIKEIQHLLLKPSDDLTEDDLLTIHDALSTMPDMSMCSCQVNKQQCKLKLVLLSCAILNFIFPNVYSILSLYKIRL